MDRWREEPQWQAQTTTALHALANSLRDQGRIAEARATYEEALGRMEAWVNNIPTFGWTWVSPAERIEALREDMAKLDG